MKAMEYQKYRHIPNRLRECRKARDLTQEEVAAALRLKNKTLISRWETGRSVPSLVTAMRLSVIYGVDVQGLFIGLMSEIEDELRT